MKSSKTPSKIIKSFFVVGINEIKLQRYNIENNNDSQQLRFIQKIDIINTNLNIKKDRLDTSTVKWLRVLNTSNFWIRFSYINNYTDPITDLRIQLCDYYSEKYLLLPRNLYENGYRPVKLTKYQNITNNIKDFPDVAREERTFPKLDDKFVLVPAEYNSKNPLNLPTKKSGALLLISRKTIFLPLKDVIMQKKKDQNSYQFGLSRHKSPYLYKYLPEIIDSYPINEPPNQAVALFCFPEGIQIKDKFDTPKCFNFVLTDEVGERTYGSTLIFCQEISISLREAFIPSYDQPNKTYFCQKAICILSKYPFYYNCLLFLKELYNISEPKSLSKIPLERAICTFVDSLYIQTYDKLLRFNINDKNIDFYRIANYGKLWDTNDRYLETLFRVLSYEQIITAWEGLLLEKKLYLICSSKAVLSHVAYALINLLFPFKWIHVYVPILPEKLKLFIESPVPLIIGISFHIKLNELPNDSLILNIDKNCFENYNERVPPLPPKLNKILMNKLMKLKEQYNLDNPQYVEKWIFNLEEAILYLGPDTLIFPKIDTSEIRDAFFNVFINMFKNYEKHFSWVKQSINLIGTQSVFLKENFLKEHNSLEENSFLSLFCETSLFSQFIGSFGIEENNVKSSFHFFLDSIKKGKGKNKFFLQNIIPKNVVFAPKIEIDDLKDKTFSYSEFPLLNKDLYIKHEVPKIPYKSRFSYLKDEWCYSTEKFKKKDWVKYFLFLIYDIWFTFFSFVLNIYEDNQATIMMDYALSLIEYLSDTLKIPPTRNLFSKIIKSCTRNCLNPFIKQMLIMVKNINKGQSKFNALFHNDYLNGLYFLTQNVGQSILGASLNNSLLLINTLRASVINEMKKTINKLESVLNRIIFITYNICENCLMTKCRTKTITFDEILAGFISRKNDEDHTSVCSICLSRFEPKIFYIEDEQDNLNLKEINLLTPIQLKDKIDEIIKEKGELYFYQQTDWNEVYWNIVFYFQLFDLPTCVLYVENNMEKFEKLNNELKENRKRKLNKEKKVPKKSFFFRKTNKTINDVTNDISLDNSRYTNTTNNISDISINSVKSGYSFSSNTEMDIWKNYQLQKQNKKKELKHIKEINIINDDKNEVNLNVKETKSFLSDIISYFNNNSQEKLKKFLDKYDKLEAMRQHDYVNMCLKKENEKFDKINQIKQKENEIKNIKEIKNTQIKNNQQDIKENEREEEQPKNQQKNENENIQQSLTKNDDKFSINTNYNFKIGQRSKMVNNNDITKENKQDINIQKKIPLDSFINENENINETKILVQNKTIIDNNININNKPNIISQNKPLYDNNNINKDNLIVQNKTIYDSNKNELNKNKIININKTNMLTQDETINNNQVISNKIINININKTNNINNNDLTQTQNRAIYDNNNNRYSNMKINNTIANNNINVINNNIKYNRINAIHSPQKKSNILFNPNIDKQRVKSTKTEKLKVMKIYNQNNKLYIQPEQINNNLNNNNIAIPNSNIKTDYNFIPKSSEIYSNQMLNQNNYNINKNNINSKILGSKTIVYQPNYGNINNRYIQPNTNINDNIQISSERQSNLQKEKNQQIQNLQNYQQQQQIINQQKQNIHVPKTNRIQNYQAELTRQKYQIHQVPAYKSIFDDNYNI